MSSEEKISENVLNKQNIEEMQHLLEVKSTSRIGIASMLIGICFTVFTLVWGFGESKPLITWILAQLILAIPILYYSTTAYSKMGYKYEMKEWKSFATNTFILGFSLMMNAVGIMVYVAGLIEISIIFYFLMWILEGIYSAIDIKEDRKNLKERVIKSGFFIFLTFTLGLLVVIIDHFKLLQP